MPVLPGAEPFEHDGSADVGVLLCHGLTGSPHSLRPWGERLAAEDYSVRCPRLPGHGTHWREVARTRWQDWYECVERSLDELRDRCGTVFVAGLSMGGTLALRLAELRQSDIAGLMLVNPSVMTRRRLAALTPWLAHVMPTTRGIAGGIAKPGVREVGYDRLPLRSVATLAELWRLVRADLGKVRQPVLLFHSVVDEVVEPVNSRIVLDSVRSTDVTDVVLTDSGHVATLDYDADIIFNRSVDFVRRVHAAQAGDRP
ncbi:alpha/beta hydrolase [Actinoalloteichus spitiensis]|uniref:alpha/beta hydrolase n=1 Tax=Actinoalloteichus spitiensis TaxID=252394 RepID=UPI000372CD6E|nr:alpha/beta fold hydrolase [Actinoalloteichus spitiensis]